MQRASQTPKRSAVHHSLDYLFTEKALRRSLATSRDVDEMRVVFAKFVGSVFPDMPREGVTYYPVIALFRVPAGRRLITFDQYRIGSGITALIYPVYRLQRASIQKRIFRDAFPALRDWFETAQQPSSGRKTGSFYIYYDQTFNEVVYRPQAPG